jgi:hypothetical protein
MKSLLGILCLLLTACAQDRTPDGGHPSCHALPDLRGKGIGELWW